MVVRSPADANTNPLATLPIDAFKDDAGPPDTEPKPSIIPIFDAKTSTTSRVIRGRSKKPVGARSSRSTGMPWVHASPPDLWQIVQPSASSSKHHHNFATQPSHHTQHNPTSGFTRRSVGGGASGATQDAVLRTTQPVAVARPVPKAIGSERKQRLQVQQQQPVINVPLPTTLDWNPAIPPSSSNSWTTSVMPSSISLPSPPSTPALGESKRFGPQISICVPEKQKNTRVTPLPTPPPTPPPLSLTIVELTPAPVCQYQLDAAAAFERKYELVTRFNSQRTRGGGKHAPRFSSPLNPAMADMGLTFQDCLDVDKKEREKAGCMRGREKSWNYFRKQQVVGTRSRGICERWNGGGSGSISSYLRGSEQKHCLGCRREGLRVRSLVVGVWRWGVLFGESVGDSGFEDDEDDDDILTLGSAGKTGRFVMDYWDDDEDLSGRGMLMRREHGDVPMDVDHDSDSVLDVDSPSSLEAELARASGVKMEVDSNRSETEWVGGVPDSPRLKDLDDFDEI
ncbi:hypothetical protein PQX77_005567 [Marasmius sp. AFHP31]|nr:hypothetical protein PQX77_005567 [Marasmius sp. AFHP31]